MRALLLDRIFPSLEAIQLQVSQVPKPQIVPDHCLVRVHAAGINSSDVGGVLGYFPNSKLPRTPGRDFAGIVEDGPAEWVGKRVWGSLSGIYQDGVHAEYIQVPASQLGELPSNISPIQGASMGVPLVTAYLALFQTNPLQKGEKVLITGANGAVGLCAMQLARWKGAIPVGLVRSEEKRDFLKKFGFNSEPEGKDVICMSREDWQAQAKSYGPYDRILNGLGNIYFNFLLNDCLSDGGSFITYSALPGQREITVDLFQQYRRRLTFSGINTIHEASKWGFIFQELKEGFESEALKSLVVEEKYIFELEQASDAYRASKTINTSRVVLNLLQENQ